ncbi:hypothetical protein RchiOBHm_Chr3g0474521 [Rosa chinensis]|uniref:Uncharacterized protein n=1 Tax=Rosa chinensis TaxID=74649 RepID=A0A2P6RC56_ROSCH|nr:hypothetical protein RchiOBHm_Chr3g0474521 [Rosa chinensis]
MVKNTEGLQEAVRYGVYGFGRTKNGWRLEVLGFLQFGVSEKMSYRGSFG